MLNVLVRLTLHIQLFMFLFANVCTNHSVILTMTTETMTLQTRGKGGNLPRGPSSKGGGHMKNKVNYT